MRTIITFSLFILLVACNVKDTIYEATGKVTLVTDWTNRTDGIDIPASCTAVIDGQTLTLTGTTYPLPEMEAGTYPVLIYNTADKVSVSGTEVTIQTETGTVHPAPGWLFTYAGNITAETAKETTVTAAMQQQVRELTLVIKPSGTTAERIAGITGTLSGAAGTLDFAGGTHGTPSEVALPFTKITEGTNAGRWLATIRLLGVAGAEQKLNATITFSGGTLPNIPLESDLSAKLVDFNTGKKNPLTLDGEAELHSRPGFTATINGWEVVSGGSGIAN